MEQWTPERPLSELPEDIRGLFEEQALQLLMDLLEKQLETVWTDHPDPLYAGHRTRHVAQSNPAWYSDLYNLLNSEFFDYITTYSKSGKPKRTKVAKRRHVFERRRTTKTLARLAGIADSPAENQEGMKKNARNEIRAYDNKRQKKLKARESKRWPGTRKRKEFKVSPSIPEKYFPDQSYQDCICGAVEHSFIYDTRFRELILERLVNGYVESSYGVEVEILPNNKVRSYLGMPPVHVEEPDYGYTEQSQELSQIEAWRNGLPTGEDNSPARDEDVAFDLPLEERIPTFEEFENVADFGDYRRSRDEQLELLDDVADY